MLKNIIIISIAIITLTISSFAQRPTPGQMGGLLGVGTPSGGGTSSATGTTELVLQSNGQSYGTGYAYNGSHFEIYAKDGSVLKTYSNSCKEAAPSGGVTGLVCTFGHFNSNGQLMYSGWTYIYSNGFVYLRWMYQARSNFQYVDGDTGWIGLMPKS